MGYLFSVALQAAWPTSSFVVPPDFEARFLPQRDAPSPASTGIRCPDAATPGPRRRLRALQVGPLAWSARAQPAATTARFSSTPPAWQTAYGRPRRSSPVIRQATGASRTSAARALVAAAPQSSPRVALDADRAARRRLDALQPHDTVAQPQRAAVNHGNLCGLSVQLLRERDSVRPRGGAASRATRLPRRSRRRRALPPTPSHRDGGSRNERSVAGGCARPTHIAAATARTLQCAETQSGRFAVGGRATQRSSNSEPVGCRPRTAVVNLRL